MSNRVLLGALGGGDFGLRVSRPGYDVTNTGLTKEQLAFDSRWSEVSNVWMSGSRTYVASSVSGHTGEMNVSYGTTFSTPPMVLVLVKYKVPNQSVLTMYHIASNLDGSSANDPVLSYVLAGTSSFWVGCPSANGKTFHYIVLRNVYG